MNTQAHQHMPLNPEIVTGAPFKKGTGFHAKSYRHSAFNGKMDPLVMVDHYHMSAPTFGAHAHAGLSAVSIIFEDSIGQFRNQDSMGNDIDLEPGDVYWLSAGKGAVHDEYPRLGAKTHGLQVFVNTPQNMRHLDPESLHIKANSIPVIEREGHRVRVLLGETNQVQSQNAPTIPLTILDGFVEPQKHFEHIAKPNHNTWIIALEGALKISVGSETFTIQKDEALALAELNSAQGSPIRIENSSENLGHFALFSGQMIKEPFVQEGPFIMSTQEQIEQVRADYEAGRLGSIE